MKKTLIALMALAGVACGATGDAVTLNLKKLIQEYGYDSAGCGFVLETVVSTSPSTFFTFNSDGSWILFSQEQKYFGVSTAGDPGDWVVSSSGVTSFEAPLVVGETKSWLVGPKHSGTVTITLACAPIAAGESVQYATNLRVAAADGSILINSSLMDPAGGQTVGFDLNGVTFNSAVSSAYVSMTNAKGELVLGGFDVVKYIPEPTTATLSLLALCGLAARRRRR